MKILRLLLLAGLVPLMGLTPAAAAAAKTMPAAVQPAAKTPTQPGKPDSKQMEYDLQHLSWKQFRTVVEAIPKLRAGIEAYGPAGWQFVQANYARYGWQRPIDKLDSNQKQRLAELIQKAKAER